MNTICMDCQSKNMNTKAVYFAHPDYERVPDPRSICRKCWEEYNGDVPPPYNEKARRTAIHSKLSRGEIDKIESDEITLKMIKDWDNTDYYWRSKR